MSSGDRNFDAVYERFQRNIKKDRKGILREILLREDLSRIVQAAEPSLDILDAGCGLGDMSLWFASLGHRVRATDISAKMVAHAEQAAADSGLNSQIQVMQQSAQEALSQGQSYDLICLHAVLEWLKDPYELLSKLPAALRPGGTISISFYNLHRSVFNSLVKGDFRRIIVGNYAGHQGSLTPPSPIDSAKVRAALEAAGFEIELEAGVRCFFDYFYGSNKDDFAMEDLLTLERRYRHQSPYREMARYIHVMARLQ